MNKQIIFSIMAVLILAGCGGVKVQPGAYVFRLPDSTIVAVKDQKVYKLDEKKGLLASPMKYDDLAFEKGKVGIIQNKQYFDVDLSGDTPVLTKVAPGSQIDVVDSKFYIRDRDYIRVYSNRNEVDFYLFRKDYDQAEVWNDRFLLTMNKDRLQVWDIRQNSDLSEKKVLHDVQTFTMDPGSPTAYLVQNSNRIVSVQLYSGQTNIIDKLPFPVKGLEYHPLARMLMVSGKGVMAFYHTDSKRIEMGHMAHLDMYYDVDSSELVILKTNSILVVDFTTKSNVNEMKLEHK